MTEPQTRVAPETVGETRQEADIRRATDRSGKTILGWGATWVAVFGVVAILFLIFLFVIIGNGLGSGAGG